MSHTNNCHYCKSQFKFKFSYRKWSQVSKEIYDRAVRQMSPTESITFIFNNRPWIIDYTCGSSFGIDAGMANKDELDIYLTEPLTFKEAKAKNKAKKLDKWLTPFAEIEKILPNRDLERLKTINKKDAELDLDIYVCDIFGDDKQHHCGIVEIIGSKNIKIMLEEAWIGKCR